MFNPQQFYESGKSRLPIFEGVFDTTKTSAGSTSANQLRLFFGGGSGSFYPILINWGDGSSETYLGNNIVHTYIVSGVYTVTIKGFNYRLSFGGAYDRLKILEIKNWGNLNIYYGSFNGCSNLILSDVNGKPRFDPVSDNIFQNCTSITTIKGINDWNFGSVITLAGMFSGCSNFNQDLNFSSVTSVTNFSQMFFNCIKFNGSVTLNSTSLTNITSMFQGCTIFNKPININTNNLNNMVGLFRDAKAFNQDVSGLNTSQCTNLSLIFLGATDFNQDISTWDISSSLSVNGLFLNATNFNQDIAALNFNRNVDTTNIMNGKTFSNYNKLYYNNLLQKWATKFIGTGRTNTNKNINMGTIRYTSAGKPYRDALIADGWSITDGGI